MTVYNELNKIAYIGSSEQTLYPIPFEYISTDDIKVSVYTSNNEFVEDWTYSIQYVIEGGNVKVLSGYNIDNTKKLLILRSVDLIQDNKYREGGDFPAKSTETSFDKLTMITQQLQETLDRCVKVEVLDNQTPEELLQTVYDKLDSATEIAEDAISAANQAQTAADNATAAVNSAEQTLAEVTAYVDAAKVDVDNTKNTAINTINSTVAQAKTDINTAVSNAENNISTIVSDAEGSIASIAVTEANKAIANAAQVATDTATANVNNYVNDTIKPYVDQAQKDANSAATSMKQAALSATAASNYASNASADADNAAKSAGLAANSATEASNSEEKAAEYLQQISNKITTVDGSIGDIGFAPLGIDEAQNKRRYLNGQVISQAQFVSFTNKIKAAIALYPNLATSETNWQAEKTNSKLGQCGKFVIDDTAGTIRLPKVVNIQGLQDLALMGSVKSESLPNIKGQTRANIVQGGLAWTGEGALYGSRTADGFAPDIVSSQEHFNDTINFDASRSSSTYQDNAPVQQEAVQYPYFIQVATGVEESVDVTREIELNNPFFLGMHIWSDIAISNASWLISNGSYHSGATYVSFYEWLLQKINEKSKQLFGWKINNSLYWTDTETPQINDLVYGYGYKSKVIIGYVSAVNGSSITIKNTYTTNTTTGCVRYTSLDAFCYIMDKDGINFVTNKDLAANYPPGYNHNFDYDFVINTADTTFRLPIKVKLASGSAVVGNGMTLGLTNGQGNAGLNSGVLSADSNVLIARMTSYGQPVGNTGTAGLLASGTSLGLTTDPTKSGIETSSSGLKLYFYVGETIQDANLINAGQMSALISQLRECHVVIETYKNGASWYRIYDDGWCEQGGTRVAQNTWETITFLKPFINTNYTALVSNSAGGTGANSIRNKTTASMQIYQNLQYDWYACGYASPENA